MSRSAVSDARNTFCILLAAVVFLTLAACGGGSDPGRSAGATGANPPTGTSSATGPTPRHGGSVVDLLNAGFAGNWPAGLDPATNPNGGATLPQNQAIFGGLFLLRADKDGSNARIVGNQAKSGTLSPDAKTLTIKLRPGIEFSDGTPLDAEAVIWNFKRDTNSSCSCAPAWNVREDNPFTSPDPLTVQVHFSTPNAAILHGFPVSNVNWMVSPTAFKKMGKDAFRLKPVGAGPFTVVSNKLSSTLVVKANPNYFREGLPYLDKITFQSISTDQAAYQAMLAGQGDAYEGASATPVIRQAQQNKKIQVTVQPGTSPYVVQLNTRIPPFNNIKAREAIYYATNWQAINKGLFDGQYTVVQGFTTPVDLFYHKTVPGYRAYDLAKAKQLVKQVGGINIELDTVAVYTAKQINKALQAQWSKAGMNVTIKNYQLGPAIKRFSSGKWQAYLQTAGAWDPAVGVGVTQRFGSESQLSGVHDRHLDQLIQQGLSAREPAARDRIYQKIAKYISDKAYAPFGFAIGPAQFAVPSLHGPGLTTKIPALILNTGVIWGEVWTEDG